MTFDVIIPVRFHSTRLPGKALLDIAGKPMVARVFEQARLSQAKRVIIATDDARIAKVVEALGAEVCMTRNDHGSGTERLIEVVEKCQFDPNHVIVNVQGDEPLIPPENIDQVAALLLNDSTCAMATLQEKLTEYDDLFNPNIVKVTSDQNGHALYFSRAPIPWNRDEFKNVGALSGQKISGGPFYRHVGLYAYRVSLLQKYMQWSPSPYEPIETLEQLRVLWHGERIKLANAKKYLHVGVDTEADLQKVRQFFMRMPS